jgi:hypothetical protein
MRPASSLVTAFSDTFLWGIRVLRGPAAWGFAHRIHCVGLGFKALSSVFSESPPERVCLPWRFTIPKEDKKNK